MKINPLIRFIVFAFVLVIGFVVIKAEWEKREAAKMEKIEELRIIREAAEKERERIEMERKYSPIGEYYQESLSKDYNEEAFIKVKEGGKWEMERYINGKIVEKDSGRWFFKTGIKENKIKDPKTYNLFLVEFKDEYSGYEYRIFNYDDGCITIPDNAAILEQINPYDNKNAVFEKSIFKERPYFIGGDLSHPFLLGSLILVWDKVCKN